MKEKYVIERSPEEDCISNTEVLHSWLIAAKAGDNLKKILVPKTSISSVYMLNGVGLADIYTFIYLDYGPALTEHVLLEYGFPASSRIGSQFEIERDLPKLHLALKLADNILKTIGNEPKVTVHQSRGINLSVRYFLISHQGYIIQKKESRPTPSGETQDFLTNQEFHPMLYKQHESQPYQETAGFNEAVDEFFSKMESQKFDLRAVQLVVRLFWQD